MQTLKKISPCSPVLQNNKKERIVIVPTHSKIHCLPVVNHTLAGHKVFKRVVIKWWAEEEKEGGKERPWWRPDLTNHPFWISCRLKALISLTHFAASRMSDTGHLWGPFFTADHRHHLYLPLSELEQGLWRAFENPASPLEDLPRASHPCMHAWTCSPGTLSSVVLHEPWP